MIVIQKLKIGVKVDNGIVMKEVLGAHLQKDVHTLWAIKKQLESENHKKLAVEIALEMIQIPRFMKLQYPFFQ